MKSLILAAFILTPAVLFAQNAKVSLHTAPLAGSVVLKDVDDKYSAHVYNLESPAPDASEERKKLYEVKKQIATMFPYKRLPQAQNKTTAVPAPIVAAGYVADSFTGIPPDNDMAISKGNKAVSVVNSSLALTDANSGLMTYRKDMFLFSFAAGLTSTNDYKYDPKIIYDPQADRYICVMLNATDELNYIVLAFSQTNDPSGKWNFYKFKGDYAADSTWFDFPSIAITNDEFFLTGNKIKYYTSWQAGFRGSVIYQVNKQGGYNGDANITYKIWDGINNGSVFIRNLYPVKGGGSILGPSQYFLSNRNFDTQNDTIFLVKVPDVINSGNNNLEIKVLTSPIKYGVPPEGRQPDTSATLATNDGRILGAFADGNEIQFVSATVNQPSGSSAVFHGVISDYTNNPSITHASIIAVDTLDFGYPNVTYIGNPWGLRQSLISFNYTGPNMYPGLGAVLYNGVDYSPMTQVKTGVGSIKILSGKTQRWGDYMGAQVDWNNIGTVWIEGIYGRADKRYGCWMAKLNSPLLGVKQTAAAIQTAKLYPNPAFEMLRFEFDMDESELVHFQIYDMWGREIDNILNARCKQGHNALQFNIGALQAGTYILSATTYRGEEVIRRQFVKQ